jgi:hypothetical protein
VAITQASLATIKDMIGNSDSLTTLMPYKSTICRRQISSMEQSGCRCGFRDTAIDYFQQKAILD